MRTDAVAVILEVIARMRQLDPRLKVTWEPGWERRGNGLAARYVGGIVHDTTTPSSPAKPFPTQNLLRDGRVDLSGPIANFGGPYCTVDAPWIHVTAAFPANHAGASGGRSMGPLPRTSLFNPTVLGLEIDFSGLAPMPAGQMYVGKLWARAVADVLAGGNLEYVRAHFETSITGKIDISYGAGKSNDMAVFRRDAATLTAPQPHLLEDDMPYIIRADKRADAVLVEGSFIGLSPGTDEYKNWLSAGAKEVWVMPGTWDAYANGGAFRIAHVPDAQDKTNALLEQLIAKISAPAVSSAGATLTAAQIATAVNDEDDRRDRDGDPATGPVS